MQINAKKRLQLQFFAQKRTEDNNLII